VVVYAERMLVRVRKKILWILLALALLLIAQSRYDAQTPSRQTGGKTIYAESFPGNDLGAKINAADNSLGTAPGEIVTRGGGRLVTQIVISRGHTLRLGKGTYTPVSESIPILLKQGARLTGEGWDQTIILESPAKNQFTVVGAYNSSNRNGAADSDITITNLQIKGANPEFNSAQQAISLGNCSRCTVDHVWINGTRAIGIAIGGAAFDGNLAQDSKVVNCLFTRVASQNLALVNGRNITFENNRFLAPGQNGGPGSTNIDLEPNDRDDHIENVVIRNNVIDARDSEVAVSGNGILVQSGTETPFVGPILIEGNTIIGGSNSGTITNKISNGIYVFGPTMKNVTIRNNKVTRTGQSGLRIEGSHFIVTGNQFTDVGGGGTAGFVMSITDSQITGNSFSYSGAGPVDARVDLATTNRNNVIRDNPGLGFPPRAQ
jgi:hypothetical protein